MKRLLAVAVTMFALGGFAYALDIQNHMDNATPRPIFCYTNISTTTYSTANGAGTVAISNRAVDGYIQNMGTAGILLNLTSGATQTIVNNGIRLYPCGDQYGRDKFPLRHETAAVVGNVYFVGIDSTNFTAITTGEVIAVEFQQ